MSRSIPEGPLDFEITRVGCIKKWSLRGVKIIWAGFHDVVRMMKLCILSYIQNVSSDDSFTVQG